MTGTALFRCSLVFLVTLLGTTLAAYGADAAARPANALSVVSAQSSHDVTGTWSGTFQSRQPSFSPFTITVVIRAAQNGRLVGSSSVSSDCLKDSTLEVTVKGSQIDLAGGDEEGNHVTFEGTIDHTGTIINLKYVLNGSNSARCESDDGTGTMVKR
jgi:hypothetical protein